MYDKNKELSSVLKTKPSFSIFYQICASEEGIWWYVQDFVSLSILLHDQLHFENAAAFGQGKVGEFYFL